MRAGQALLTTRADHAASRPDQPETCRPGPYVATTARAHLYVDDAAAIFSGSAAGVVESFDLLLLFWLILGAPLSWPKVSLSTLGGSQGPCRWIGVDFDVTAAGARMQLPAEFLADLAAQVEALSRTSGRISDSEVHQLCGRAARVAYVVPAATPFAAALRAALADSRETG